MGGRNLAFGSRRKQQPALATVATVNGEGITQYDLHYTFLNNLQRIEQEQGGILPAGSHEAVKFQALQSLIETTIIRQEIANRGGSPLPKGGKSRRNYRLSSIYSPALTIIRRS